MARLTAHSVVTDEPVTNEVTRELVNQGGHFLRHIPNAFPPAAVFATNLCGEGRRFIDGRLKLTV